MATITEHSTVKTQKAAKYLKYLSRHFRAKVPVDFDEEESHVDFPWGKCHMRAEPDALAIKCWSEDRESLERIKYVVEDHVVRFAKREELVVEWRQV